MGYSSASLLVALFLPLVLLYAMAGYGIWERRQARTRDDNKSIGPILRIHDACIAAIVLDLAVLFETVGSSLGLVTQDPINREELTAVALYMVLTFAHIMALFFSDRFNAEKSEHRGYEGSLGRIGGSYLATIVLFTNGVTLSGIIDVAGGTLP